MKRLLCIALLYTAATTSLTAQSFGELFPLTNTRYRTTVGIPRLATNGQDFFLFWGLEGRIRATRLREGETRAGHVVFDSHGGFDVGWLGNRFLVVSWRTNPITDVNTLLTRQLDANAQPIGPEIKVASSGFLPKVAIGSRSSLVTYVGAAGSIRSILLGREGQNIGAQDRILGSTGTSHAVASNGEGFLAVLSNREEIRAFVFDDQGQLVTDHSLPRPSTFYRELALTSNGTGYLATWSEEQQVMAATIDENGVFGSPMVVGSVFRPGAPAAAWTGDRWAVAYDGPRGEQARTHIVQLDPTAQTIVATEESATGTGDPSVAALDGRIMAAWRHTSPSDGTAAVAELPLAQSSPRIVTYSATHQTLLATTASPDATLVVWRERIDGRDSIRSGRRTHDGQWSERELANFPNAGTVRALATTAGRQFAVAIVSNETELIRLDEDGTPGQRVTLPLRAAVMAWNGAHYAVVDEASAVLVNADGEVAATVTIPDLSFSPNAIASNGDGFFLAGEQMDCQFLFCTPTGLAGTRLGPALQRIDAQDLVFTTKTAVIAGAAWNGSEYMMVWTSDAAKRLVRVPSSPSQAIESKPISVPLDSVALAITSDGSIALAGRADPGSTSRVVFLRNDGSLAGTFDIESLESINGQRPRLAALPDGGVAYVSSSIQDAPPHHGMPHVMMAIARSTPLPRPSAPHVSARIDGNDITIDWSAPSGTINGYRIEYRVDDGSWNELDEWFPAPSHHTSIRKPDFGTNIAIRMRAFNDGGTSPYSSTSVTKPSRRRAVR